MTLATMQKVNLGFDIFWTSSVLVTDIILLIFLGFQYTSGAITNLVFFVVYAILGLISTLLAGLAVGYHVFIRAKNKAGQQEVASALFISDTVQHRWLSSIPVKILVFAALTALVGLIVLTTGSIVNAPNPYSSAALDAAVLNQHSFLQNTFNVAVYPGFYEEAPIFHLDSIIVMLITFGSAFVFKNPALAHHFGVFLIAVVIAVTIGAAVFATAHNTAYGLDLSAKVSAYVFDWILQFTNQVTGIYGSWLPHAMNNGAVMYRTQRTDSVGGQPA